MNQAIINQFKADLEKQVNDILKNLGWMKKEDVREAIFGEDDLTDHMEYFVDGDCEEWYQIRDMQHAAVAKIEEIIESLEVK